MSADETIYQVLRLKDNEGCWVYLAEHRVADKRLFAVLSYDLSQASLFNGTATASWYAEYSKAFTGLQIADVIQSKSVRLREE